MLKASGSGCDPFEWIRQQGSGTEQVAHQLQLIKIDAHRGGLQPRKNDAHMGGLQPRKNDAHRGGLQLRKK
eukprot:1157755-Pelagomonas_calceolata.AAC.3